MKFSQRIGVVPASKVFQQSSVDVELRTSLWNLLCICYWDTFRGAGDGMFGRSDRVAQSNLHTLILRLWLHYFKKPTDTIDKYWPVCYGVLRSHMFDCEWYEVYDFVEFVAENGPEGSRATFIAAANSCLETENSAFRFVSGKVTEIMSKEEISEVEAAIKSSSKFSGVATHLQSALSLFSDRKNPDYRNSIKESISAVESLAIQISGNTSGTLGSILKELERKKQLHPALKSAFSSLYGYTSDAHGIRHAILEEHTLTKADARLLFIMCSSFINFVIDTFREEP